MAVFGVKVLKCYFCKNKFAIQGYSNDWGYKYGAFYCCSYSCMRAAERKYMRSNLTPRKQKQLAVKAVIEKQLDRFGGKLSFEQCFQKVREMADISKDTYYRYVNSLIDQGVNNHA